ncbi:glutathione peroxidase [Gracilimonas sp. BCB1]|uniref:glutathione peroxidase n=1 Tax=Gracilimonas sp. BCB1 TaxID=3152362 RepID=UPI0032D95CE7
MKILFTALVLAVSASMGATEQTSLYDFTVQDIDGEEVSLEQYKGQVILVVNVASKCGYTPQYEGLQKIYEAYKDEGFVILGFPANNFNGQEPGTDQEIKQFCTLEYGVEFPMFSKVSVKGEDQAALFSYLTSLPNDDFDGEIKWNFEKFLIDKNGLLKRRFRSSVEPQSKPLVNAIEKELNG